MNNILCFGDSHITSDSITELDRVFKEILSNKGNCTELVCLGDYYDKKRPSVDEIMFGTKWAKIFKDNFSKCIMLRGNHAELSTKLSNVDYLEYLGWKIEEDYITSGIFFGHFMTSDSAKHFGEYSKDKNISFFKNYVLSVLGHQHDYQEMTNNTIHLGSCRFVSFGEKLDELKYILKIENNKPEKIPLTTYTPIISTENISLLEGFPQEYKVRLVFKDFNNYKSNLNTIEKLRNKFNKFKIKLDFVEGNNENPIQGGVVKQNDNYLVVSIIDWLNNIKDEDVKKELKEEFNIEIKNTII